METQPILSIPITSKTILRLSIYTFLKHYQYLTSIASTLALPFALSVLFSQLYVSHFSNFYPTIANNLHSLCESLTFLPFIDVNFSQTIITFIFTSPLSISFLLLAKASVISTIFKKKCFISLYKPLLVTHLCNYLVIFSINATYFFLLFLALAFFEGFQITTSPRWILFLSILCAVSYSIVLANALVICNLALVSSAMDEGNGGGVIAILKACGMIKGRTAIALGLTLPINLGLASIESLFHYRVATPWNQQSISFGVKNKKIWVIGFEGVFIAYLYTMIIMLDVIISCLFYQSCKMNKFTYHYETNDDNGEKLKGLNHYV